MYLLPVSLPKATNSVIQDAYDCAGLGRSNSACKSVCSNSTNACFLIMLAL